MARFHLVGDVPCDVLEGEIAGFLRHSCMKDDLEQEVAEFAAQIAHVATFDRVGDFVGFLDCVWGDGGEVLRRVPLAARLRVAQARHDREKPVGLF